MKNFRYYKQINLWILRINLSKSGVGFSLNIWIGRVGIRPDGVVYLSISKTFWVFGTVRYVRHWRTGKK